MSDHGRLDERPDRDLQIKWNDGFGNLLSFFGMFDPEADLQIGGIVHGRQDLIVGLAQLRLPLMAE